jgi:hypothetical protein
LILADTAGAQAAESSAIQNSRLSVSNGSAQANELDSSNIHGTEVAFPNLNAVTWGGNGAVSTNADGVQMATSDFIWETFNLSVTNGITLGALDYSLSNACNSVVGMYLNGKPITFIQSAPENGLTSVEIFPLSSALGAGNYALTVSLESLDGTPVAATMKKSGFYWAVSQPVITSQGVDTNGQFSLSWEAGAGLKYRSQSNNDLTSSNWTDMGLFTSPTNAILSAFDTINGSQQRFYRVKLEQ